MSNHTPRKRTTTGRAKHDETEQIVAAEIISADIATKIGEMQTEQYTFADAQLDAAAAAQARIESEIREAAARVERASASLKRARVALDQIVARAVSSQPKRPDWYEHAGPLDRRRVAQAAGLSTVALHRLMERHRSRQDRPRRGSK